MGLETLTFSAKQMGSYALGTLFGTGVAYGVFDKDPLVVAVGGAGVLLSSYDAYKRGKEFISQHNPADWVIKRHVSHGLQQTYQHPVSEEECGPIESCNPYQ